MIPGDITVLCVDDSADDLELLGRPLRAAGYDVCAARTVAEATAVLAARRVDILLVDLLMWPASGLDLVRGVRRNPVLAKLPILVITGHEDPGLRAQVIKLGCQGYLLKPMQPPERIVQLVGEWTGTWHRRRREDVA